MIAVVDASYAVAATWESSVEDQLDVVFGDKAIVPPLFMSEIANVALTKVRNGELSVEEARAGIGYLANSVSVSHSAPTLITFETALNTGLSIYDANYLVCAQAVGAPLWTLGRQLRAAAEASGVTVLP